MSTSMLQNHSSLLKVSVANWESSHITQTSLTEQAAGNLGRRDPKLTEAVVDFPRPQSVHDVRRFLGLASYYRRVIFHFAKIARPLHKLTCKDTRFDWPPECQIAFQELKQRLSSAPILAYPNFDAQFVVETNASIKGLGAVLSQVQEGGNLHPVGNMPVEPSARWKCTMGSQI